MQTLPFLSTEWDAALFEQAPVPMAVVAPDHHFVRCNAAYCELVGYSKGELTGRTWQSITHPDDLYGDQLGAEEVKHNHSQPNYTISKRYLSKRGSVVWVNLFVRGVWQDEKFCCYFITAIRQPYSRCQGCPGDEGKPTLPVGRVGSITEWAKENPKDAVIVVTALAAFLGRDAVLDLIKLVFIKP